MDMELPTDIYIYICLYKGKLVCGSCASRKESTTSAGVAAGERRERTESFIAPPGLAGAFYKQPPVFIIWTFQAYPYWLFCSAATLHPNCGDVARVHYPHNTWCFKRRKHLRTAEFTYPSFRPYIIKLRPLKSGGLEKKYFNLTRRALRTNDTTRFRN